VEVLLALSWSKVEDVLPLFMLLLSDLLSEELLELGVELELVSWLCARAEGAASARARTDNATNFIEASAWGCGVRNTVAIGLPVHNARPLASRNVRRTS
jgi:hypothetical protein